MSTPSVGIYVGQSPSAVTAYESWLGAPVDNVSIHSGKYNWLDWTNSATQAAANFGTLGRELTFSIPIFPGGADLQGAAAGLYQANYVALAQNLAAALPNQSTIYIRTGEEFNGGWFPWQAAGHEQEFIAAYRNFVTAFRSVSPQFKFEWNVSMQTSGIDPATAYPGDAYVDVIGMDFYYDIRWELPDGAAAFNSMVTRKYGLQWLENFAAAHGKPTAYSEWGTNTDSPEFINRALNWFAGHNVVYNTYWETNNTFTGALAGGQYPNAAAVFHYLQSPTTPMTGAGDDILTAISANTYFLDAGGVDTVLASMTYTLKGGQENLTLTGSAVIDGSGNEVGNVIVGNGVGNVLDGMAGNDTLDGAGGADTLFGGVGADSLVGGLGGDSLSGGAGADTLLGGDGNDTLDGGTSADRMEGGLGDDTYYCEWNEAPVELPGGGIDTVYMPTNYTLGAELENLILTTTANYAGTGNLLDNRITGNSGNNSLSGMDGADTLAGGSGADTLSGGLGNDQLAGGIGNDSLIGGTGSEIFVFAPGDGADTISASMVEGDSIDLRAFISAGQSPVLANVGANLSVTFASGDQLLVLAAQVANTTLDAQGFLRLGPPVVVVGPGAGNDTLTGGTGADTIGGLGGSDSISGGLGGDSLDGGTGSDTLDGGSGADTMTGGVGNDVFVVDNAADTVIETAGGGTDLVNASISYTLVAEVENLTLTGGATINGTGNGLANIINGNGASNTLDGGVGSDTLSGGAGDDTYVVDDVVDQVNEAAGAGIDTIRTAVTYSLAALANVENLTLTGTGAVNATGNGAGNILTGNGGSNSLDGGAGSDTLIGGLGDDSYIVADVGDVAVEAAGAGADTVYASVSFTLGAEIENLMLTGAANIDATGNALDNAIVGNSGDNVLSGLGGVDVMTGGLGADTYVVADLQDSVIENAGEGTDTVQTALTYSLATLVNVENLTLTGTGNVDGVGNAGANVLTGNSGNNSLAGGAGADTLIGGAGDDTYLIDSTDSVVEAASGGVDTIIAPFSYVLGGNIEKLVLSTAASSSGTGNAMDNTINGNSGANVLSGLAGNDSLSASGGSDSLNGGLGADSLFGAAGNDRFVYSTTGDSTVTLTGRDVVLDFVSGVDKIDLTGIDAIVGGLDNAFTLVAAFTGAAGQLTSTFVVDRYVVQGDVTGDGLADFAIDVMSPVALIASDFLL